MQVLFHNVFLPCVFISELNVRTVKHALYIYKLAIRDIFEFQLRHYSIWDQYNMRK